MNVLKGETMIDRQSFNKKFVKNIIITVRYIPLTFVIIALLLLSNAYSFVLESKQENEIIQKLRNNSVGEVWDIQDQQVTRTSMADEPKIEESLIVPFDPIIVNLSNTNARRYLKATINFEVKSLEVKNTVLKRVVQIKDRLISILSSKSLEDIEGVEGQQSLRNTVRDAVNVVLKMEEAVLQVYFTEFVIQ